MAEREQATIDKFLAYNRHGQQIAEQLKFSVPEPPPIFSEPVVKKARKVSEEKCYHEVFDKYCDGASVYKIGEIINELIKAGFIPQWCVDRHKVYVPLQELILWELIKRFLRAKVNPPRGVEKKILGASQVNVVTAEESNLNRKIAAAIDCIKNRSGVDLLNYFKLKLFAPTCCNGGEKNGGGEKDRIESV